MGIEDLRQRSERYGADGDYSDEAIQTHRSLLELVLGDVPTTNRLGIALLNQGELDEAEAVFRTQPENRIARSRLTEIEALRRPKLAPVKGPRPTGRPPDSDDHEDWPEYVEHDRDAIRKLFDDGTDNWRDGLRLIAEVAPNRLTYAEIETALGWPPRRWGSVIGGTRSADGEATRPYHLCADYNSPSGEFETWMDEHQAAALGFRGKD